MFGSEALLDASERPIWRAAGRLGGEPRASLRPPAESALSVTGGRLLGHAAAAEEPKYEVKYATFVEQGT